MKVQNFTTLLLPSRKQRERNQLIANSLASSAAILDRIPAFSDSNNRGRPFVLRFHQQWRHDSCQVMGWYKQQCSSSTRFRFIEHRRNTEGPFYHEFLLLKLTDGAICRVERMGDGSRTGAIRYTGCRANDLVQWFTADNYTVLAATIPSELLAEIDFPHEYDVLDVLAVCYSIQNTRGCRIYTLQRYNCYFLCLTILAVLTRRVANWDFDTAATTWDTFISSTFDRFSGSEAEDMNRYLVLRICALLEPEDTTPTKPALDAIHRHLNSQNSIANLNDSLRGTLWAASWGQALRNGLNDTVTATVTTLLQDARAGPTRLRNIVHAVRRDVHRGIVANETLADPYCKELSKMISQYCDRKHEIYQRRFHAIEMERHFPLWSRALSKALGSVLAAVVGMYPAMWIVNEDEGDSEDDELWSFRTAVQKSDIRGRLSLMRFMRFAIHIYLMHILQPNDQLKDLVTTAKKITLDELVVLSMADVLDSLESQGVLGQTEVSLVLGAWLTLPVLHECFSSFIVAQVEPLVLGILQAHEAHIHINTAAVSGSSSAREVIKVVEFQRSYIQSRIYAHGKRIAAHQLGDAALVCEDLTNTMTEVWRFLPDGFATTLE